VSPSAAISTRNYPRPAYGNTYITNNTTTINNNYRYDSAHYQPHVANYYGQQSPMWGNHWRYGCAPSTSLGISIGLGGFGFGFYAFTPFYAPVVASPFYYDPYVPAYVPQARIVVWPSYSVGWNDGDAYAYQPSYVYDSYGDPEFNLGISTLGLVYGHRDVDALYDLMGTGQIAVFADGRYEYSMNSDDFRAMMADNCRASETVSFDILSVRHHGHYGIVRCRHRFRGPDGDVHEAYLGFNLQLAGDRYAITDFISSGAAF
jgi:hypothetical protein